MYRVNSLLLLLINFRAHPVFVQMAFLVGFPTSSCFFSKYSHSRVIETQAIVCELLENLRFSPPKEAIEIIGTAGGPMVPVIKGKMHLGPQMPLVVSVIQ